MKTQILKRAILALLMAVTAATASAYDFYTGGIYYNKLDDGKSVEVAPSDSYSGSVTIPSQVTYRGTTYAITKIGEYAFWMCALTSVSIPNSVTAIGDWAFSECGGLTSVTIGNSVTYIGVGAFYCCTGLTSVTIPNSVTHIGNTAFGVCTGLTSVTIPNSVTSIGENVFTVCTGLTSVTIPNSVTEICPRAFWGCTGLTSVTIGTSVTSIGSNTFADCKLAKVIWLPNTPPAGYRDVKSNIHYVANDRYDFSNQIKYQFLSSMFTVDGIVYVPVSPQDRTCDVIDYSYLPDYKSVVISEKVNYKGIDMSIIDIKPYSFYNNYNIESVEISNTGNVGDLAFYGCSKLQSVNIGNQVTAIGNWAFSGCSAMENISLGSKVVRIGEEAFSDCSGLTNFTSNANVPPTCGSQALDDINKWICTLYVPTESIEQYKVADHWKDFFFIEELGIEDIVVDDDNADCPVEVYSIQGVKVGDSTDGLAPGTYIVKQGRSITKQVIQ